MGTSVATSDLSVFLDMMENFNWAQIGDAVKSVSTNPVVAAEDVADVILKAGAVAGVPGFGTIDAALPFVESMLTMVPTFLGGFGGTTGAAATIATAISSPVTLTSQALSGK
jgi:hypothetical protein